MLKSKNLILFVTIIGLVAVFARPDSSSSSSISAFSSSLDELIEEAAAYPATAFWKDEETLNEMGVLDMARVNPDVIQDSFLKTVSFFVFFCLLSSRGIKLIHLRL